MDFKKHLIQFRDIFKSKYITLVKFISTFMAELFVISGAFFIVLATFKINQVAGFYSLGIILLLIGLFLTNTKR
jgi:hypothetical protein